MDIYREKLLDHYQHPRNFGRLDHADAEEALENVSCGDRIKLYLKLNGDKLESISFEGEGCAIAIASASILSEFVTGKDKKMLRNYQLDDLIKLLGVEFSPSRLKCASLSLETLKKALGMH